MEDCEAYDLSDFGHCVGVDGAASTGGARPLRAQRVRRYVDPNGVEGQQAGVPGSSLPCSSEPQHAYRDCEAPSVSCRQAGMPEVTTSVSPGAPHFVTSAAKLSHVDKPRGQLLDSDKVPRSGGRRGVLCVRIFPPRSMPLLKSWLHLPANPLLGLPGLVRSGPPVEYEQAKYFCDPCQKGFHTLERYERHQKDHIQCPVPGCNFTCLRQREQKMEIHMEALHNRPDAPNLADVGAYLAQRKNRFPTQDSVKTKIEELFYKASRGVAMPDEQRRWLRQHGVLVGKRPRTEETYIAADMLRPQMTTGGVKLGEENRKEAQDDLSGRREERQAHADGLRGNGAGGGDANDNSHQQEEGVAQGGPPSEKKSAAEGSRLSQRPDGPQGDHSRPKRIIPCGPNGTLTNAQKVQLIREQYRGATSVPRFYVCGCCGEKGQHWASDCPRKGDQLFERRVVWGEERRDPPRKRYRAEENTEATAPGEEVTNGDAESSATWRSGQQEDAGTLSCTAPPSLDGVTASVPVAAEVTVGDVGPPPEQPARRGRSPKDVPSPTDEAGTRRILTSQEQRKPRAQRRPTRPAPPPTLYERLVGDQQSREHGLLLQAIRFFTMSNFFEAH